MRVEASGNDQTPVFCIPTTLSMAEFTPLFGIRNPDTRRKLPYLDRGLLSTTIFLDGEMAASTPGNLWAETGVKCLDDALFRYCSAGGDEPASDAIHELAIVGLLRDLGPSSAEGDPGGRQAVFMSAWLSAFPVPRSFRTVYRPWFSMVARHALGGAVELSHGVGSCVALPAGLRFHLQDTGERQAKLAMRLSAASGGDSGRSLLDVIDALLRQLGVPTNLEQLQVPRDALELVLSNMVAEAPALGPPERLRSTLASLW
jgi:alcohol dehydrogenase class IV